MDYEKKYNEALERAKRWADGTLQPERTTPQGVCEAIFPELAESEDERIGKAIVEALNSHTNSINILSARGYQMEDVEAWLEKQKGQKPVEDLTEAFGKRMDAALKGLAEGVTIQATKWSEEDEDLIEEVCRCLCEYAGYYKEKDMEAVNNHLFKLSLRLKSLRPLHHWKPSEEQMKALVDCVIGNEYDVHTLVRLFAELKKL